MNTSSNPLQPMIDAHQGQQYDVPLAHYESLFAEADPTVLAARLGVPFTWHEGGEAEANTSGTFDLTLLGRPLSVTWPTLAMAFTDTGEDPDDKTHIIVADLLLHGQFVPSSGSYLAYAEVPWGAHYLKAFQGRCIMRLAYMFKDTDSFVRACEKAGGKAVEGNDPYYEFDFMGDVRVRLATWEADDEFAPTAQILFSDNAPFAFTAEDLAVVGDIVLNALKRAKLS